MASRYTENEVPTIKPVFECDPTQPAFIFPLDVSEILCRNILFHATGFTDLVHLSATCSHWYSQIRILWKNMFEAYKPSTGDCESLTSGDFKRAYWEKLQRERVVIGCDIGGAHTNNPAYYTKELNTDGTLYNKPLYLKTVCWLENGVHFNVFPGVYEVIWRIKQEQTKWGNPVPNATLYIEINGQGLAKAEGKYDFNTEKYDEWVEVSTGRVEMKNGGKITSTFKSLVPNWQDGLWFDCVFIKPLHS